MNEVREGLIYATKAKGLLGFKVINLALTRMTTPHKETILVTQSAKNEKPSYLQFLETKVKPNDS